MADADQARTAAAQFRDIVWHAGPSARYSSIDYLVTLILLRIIEQNEDGHPGETVLNRARLFPPSDGIDYLNHAISTLFYDSDERTLSGLCDDVQFRPEDAELVYRLIEFAERLPFHDNGTVGEVIEACLQVLDTPNSTGSVSIRKELADLCAHLAFASSPASYYDPNCGRGDLLYAITKADQNVSLSRGSEPQEANVLIGRDTSVAELRVAALRLLLAGIKTPDLSTDRAIPTGGEPHERYDRIITSVPAGLRSSWMRIPEYWTELYRTNRSEILLVHLALNQLERDGTAVLIVPNGIMFSSASAHMHLRRRLVDHYSLDAVISLPPGWISSHTGMTASVIVLRNTGGPSDHTWFYDAEMYIARENAPELASSRRADFAIEMAVRAAASDIRERWANRAASERNRSRSTHSFLVPLAEVRQHNFELLPQIYRTLSETGIPLNEFAEILLGTHPSNPPADASDRTRQVRVLHPSALAPVLPDVSELPLQEVRGAGRRLLPGDIVGRDLASARYWSVIPQDFEGVEAGRGLLVIRLTQEVMPPEYIAAFLSTSTAEAQIPRYSTIPRIRRGELGKIRIPETPSSHSELRRSIAEMARGLQEASLIQAQIIDFNEQVFAEKRPPERRDLLRKAASLSDLVARSLERTREPLHLFQESYPYAIARSVRRVRQSRSMADRHEAVLQCAESLVTSLGIMGISLLRHWRQESASEVLAWQEAIVRGGLSLGHWLGVIRAAGESARERGESANGFGEATISKKGGRGLLADLGKIVSLRNKVRHGGAPRTQAEIEVRLAELEPLLVRSLTESAFLATAIWINTERLSWKPNIGRYELSGLSIMGDHPDFELVKRNISSPLPDNELHVLLDGNQAVSLSPFCALADCPQCLAPELYFPDRIASSGAVLKSLDRGHEYIDSNIGNTLRIWLDSENAR